MTVSVMVFTRDLRLADNPALAAAARAPAMVPLFVVDEAILRRASGHANRLGFLLDSLRDLDSGLRNAGGALVLRAGPWAAPGPTPTVTGSSTRPGRASALTQPAVTSAGGCPNSPGSRPPVIHDPDPATRRARRYPEPVVDHRQAMATYRARRAGR